LPTEAALLPHDAIKHRVESLAWFHHFYPYLKSAHTIASRMYADPEMSQSEVFRFSAPLLAFLVLLAMAARFSRDGTSKAFDGTKMFYQEAGTEPVVEAVFQDLSLPTFLTTAGLGVVLALIILRLVVWALALGIQMFIQLDLESIRRSSLGSFEMGTGGLFM